jgi:NADH-quinone oxidoreductase subunit G
MAQIHIDGRLYFADPSDNLLRACLAHGLDLPYFCWHPALGSVGACRQCAVKQFANSEDTTGRIVMACMTPAKDQMRISIADAQAAEFRASVIEWMMTNHPHDCPVCEEGGECHLQDMTVMTGHAYRRYRFSKRTHRNQYLGPFIKHEMNRCIACYRCVRFYRDYAGGADLDVQGAHNNVYFGRDADGVLESEFAGNLVEVCPTGVFTDKTLSAAYNRKWDMRSVPSVCAHCGVGCNIFASARAGQVRRILNRFNGAVNGHFLCDRGRFGYGFANAENRPRRAFVREQGDLAPETALARFTQACAGGRIIGIGSPRASLEANFALRALVGPEAFHAGIAAPEAQCLAAILAARRSGVKTPVLPELENADAVLVLGEDIASTAPRVALALRQTALAQAQKIAARLKIEPWQDAAVREAAGDARAPFFIAAPMVTRLDDLATEHFHAAPDDIARLGFAICHELDAGAPAVEGLDQATQARASRIAQTLLEAERPLIFSGCQLGNASVLRAAAFIARALSKAGRAPAAYFAVPECNSLGLAMLQPGSVGDALEAVAAGSVAAVLVLENDLYRRADRASVDALFAGTRVIALDHMATPTTAKAAMVFPCANFAECEGSYVSAEGRAQCAYPAVMPAQDVRPAWHWLRDMLRARERDPQAGWRGFDAVVQALSAALPEFAALPEAAPAGNFRVAGARIRSQPHRYSGRTALDAAHEMHEPPPVVLPDAPFSTTMEGYYGPMPAALLPFAWAPGWNSGQSLHKFQDETGLALRGGDAGVLLPATPGGAIAPGMVPTTFARIPGRFLVLACPPVFGGEEMSAQSPSIAERAPPPCVFLNPADAQALGAQAGGPLDIVLNAAKLRLQLALAPELPEGLAVVSLASPVLPAWAVLRRVEPAP